MNSNDAGAPQRNEHLNLDSLQVKDADESKPAFHIAPIAYEEGFPFPYNNFVFLVAFETQSSLSFRVESQQPAIHDIPPTASSFIVRLPNAVSGYNDSIRVENEVAMISLAREALQPNLHHLIPRVFRWGSAKDGQGWMIQEHMLGEGLLEDFKNMAELDQAFILGQMADVLACFQRYQLPNTIKGCGGLRFNDSGKVVSGPLGFVDEGPFNDYVSLIRGTIQAKLREADSNLHLNGWKTRGIRERLDNFLGQGLNSFLDGMSEWKKVIVHGDFSRDNVLYDKSNNRLTAVLDFDFAHIASVADDFFRSLGHDIGRFPDAMQTDKGSVALRNAMLDGFPDPLPAADDEIRWPAAKAWDNAMLERHMDRPSTIPGMTKLGDVYGLHSLILPFRITNPVVVANSSPDQLQAQKEITEAKMLALLDRLGY